MTTPNDTQAPAPPPPGPCPFCGFRIDAGSARCPHCMLPLDARTLGALERLMGPWFVFEPNTPSGPGVSWQKFLDLVEKGKIRPDSVVRGPATGGLWKPARETPSVATRLGLCWACHSPLPPVQTLADCPNCGARLNGAMDWAPPAPPADGEPEPEPEAEASAAIEDLIQAGTPAGPTDAPAPRQPPGSRLFAGLAGLLAAAALGAGIGWALLFFTRDRRPPPPAESARRHRPEPDPTSGADEPWLTPRSRRAPDGPLPGDLWPDVPHDTTPPDTRPEPPTGPAGRDKQRQAARRLFRRAVEADDAGDLMKAQALLVELINEHDARVHPPGARARLAAVQDRIRAARGRPADLPPPDELARQKATAGPLLAAAKTVHAGGDLMAAQALLLKIVNAHHRAAWPAGTAELLRQVQSEIRASTRPADQLSPAELARQKASAARLYARARPLMDEGNYLAAQKPLLEILNHHHPKAWPAGALEAFRKIRKALADAPATAPSFFNIKAKP